METQSIQVESRTETGKSAARAARRSGLVPGVCYGPTQEPFNFTIAPDEINRVLFSDTGRNSVMSFELGGSSHTVMVWDLDRDPIKRNPTHVDFRVVKPDDVVVVEVPVRTEGVAIGMEFGGSLTPVRRTVKVRCTVKEIPLALVHDVTNLNLGENVLASELAPPENGEIVYKSDFVVLQMLAPRAVEEVVEVEGEGEGEEGEEAAAPAADE